MVNVKFAPTFRSAAEFTPMPVSCPGTTGLASPVRPVISELSSGPRRIVLPAPFLRFPVSKTLSIAKRTLMLQSEPFRTRNNIAAMVAIYIYWNTLLWRFPTNERSCHARTRAILSCATIESICFRSIERTSAVIACDRIVFSADRCRYRNNRTGSYSLSIFALICPSIFFCLMSHTKYYTILMHARPSTEESGSLFDALEADEEVAEASE